MVNWLATGSLAATASYRFSTRHGGVSLAPFDSLNVASWVGDDPNSVAQNLAMLSDEVSLPIHLMRPEHGVDVQDVFGDETELKLADILVTTKPQVALAASSADCVSLIAASTNKRFLLVAHIGWRGAAAGIAEKIVNNAALYGVLPTDLEIVLGPAICGHCYEVELNVQQQVCAQLPSAPVTSEKHLGLDLRVGLVDFFTNLGAKITNDLPCTMESSDLYSYRRDSKTGRQVAIAWLN